ncbi:pantetheine-phosphate adenylyltransferase [Trypanosoma grayi]|uniref:pantetheine-phosphate adenylyltransferase n=1 Tax=Trypanosoma grayi TaxID=71804 RepID=UPI0004F43D1C|nr:pantetheine-phosphate adenylyltransferase [Trypanosoma grayi]KEG08473.1 pantetheine-phosphate adenylyltransferase [Trypanosoma grayi]
MTADRGFDPIYRHVAVGGTFDQLHAGHKLLLTTAMFYATKTLRVGVTQEELLTKKSHGAYIEPFETRCATVSRFLSFLRRDIDVDVTGITEPSGGTDRIAEVEALVVSPETASAVGTINVTRASHGLPPMQSVEISYVDVDNDKHISSTELRRRLHERRQGTN